MLYVPVVCGVMLWLKAEAGLQYFHVLNHHPSCSHCICLAMRLECALIWVLWSAILDVLGDIHDGLSLCVVEGACVVRMC